ncbi:hypothetical protein C8J56DRAFT_30726 [Mycena floridula]|nr:hypothetical protein C8J56DRAFT_30726 [Mycena floridula]
MLTPKALQFPQLPGEIVLLIIEGLVECRGQAPAMQLARLSRDIRPIVERRAYRHIVLSNHHQLERFVRMLKSECRPATFYENNVQSICSVVSIPHLISTVISACPNIHTLAIRDGPDWRGQTKTIMAEPSRLHCPVGHIPHWKRGPDPFFRFVTHLHLTGLRLGGIRPKLDNLHHLSNLTHLALSFSLLGITDGSAAVAALHALISNPTLPDSLVLCIISPVHSIFHELVFASIDHPVDSRIVMAYQPPIMSIPGVLWRGITEMSVVIEDWGRRKSGKPDMWELGEDIIRSRYQGTATLSYDPKPQTVSMSQLFT